MVRLSALVLVAGCGRVGFDATPPDAASCPTAIGHDEDGDGIDDACDPCPHLPSTLADRDADGVGDLCDPHPDEPRDRIAIFEPFTVFDDDRWNLFGVPGTYTGDALAFDASEGGFSANIDQPPGESTYRVGGVIGAVGSGQRQLAILALSAGTAPYYFCELNQVEADPVARLQYTYTYDDDAFVGVETVEITGPLVERPFDLTFTQSATDLTCQSTLAPTSVSGPLRTDIDPVIMTLGGIGIAGRFDYFIQIASD